MNRRFREFRAGLWESFVVAHVFRSRRPFTVAQRLQCTSSNPYLQLCVSGLTWMIVPKRQAGLYLKSAPNWLMLRLVRQYKHAKVSAPCFTWGGRESMDVMLLACKQRTRLINFCMLSEARYIWNNLTSPIPTAQIKQLSLKISCKSVQQVKPVMVSWHQNQNLKVNVKGLYSHNQHMCKISNNPIQASKLNLGGP